MNLLIIREIPFKEMLLLGLGTLSTFLIWRVQYQKDKIKEIESQLSEKKYKLYSQLVHFIFDIMNANKLGKSLSEKELLKQILDIKKDMFLYAPDEVFKTFTKWTLAINDPENSKTHFKICYEVMKMARKDMGKTSTKIQLNDFMLFLMQNEKEYEKFKLQNGW